MHRIGFRARYPRVFTVASFLIACLAADSLFVGSRQAFQSARAAECDPSGTFGCAGVTQEQAAVWVNLAASFEENVREAERLTGRPLSDWELKQLEFWLGRRELHAEPTCQTWGNCVPSGPVEPTPTITLSDIREFSPLKPSIVSEPGEWGIVNSWMNFYLRAGTHTVSGELLDRPAQVRFTPVTTTWVYSDGRNDQLPGIGDSWQRLGVAPFSRTATAHFFRERGEYTVDARLTHRAEYRLGTGPWRPVTGSVHAQADPIRVRIFQAATVLVERACNEPPPGPGCSDVEN